MKFSILNLILIIVFAILPDVDLSYSTISKVTKPIRFFLRLFGHRGIFHSLNFFIAIAVLFFFIEKILFLPFILGYGVHILLDGLNFTGIPVFWPFNLRLKGNIKTGGLVDKIMMLFFFTADIFLIFLLIF
jgi:inner membrane protein